MKNLPTYDQFVNENFMSRIKSFFSGEKSEEDLLAKMVLDDINNIKDISSYTNYFGTVKILFKYKDLQFECRDVIGLGDMSLHVKNTKTHEWEEINSRYTKKICDLVVGKLHKKAEDERKKAEEQKQKTFESELKENGGLEKIIDNIIESSDFNIGKVIRLTDYPKQLTIYHDTPRPGSPWINCVVFNLDENTVELYKGLGGHKHTGNSPKIEGKLSKNEFNIFNKYLKMLKDIKNKKEENKKAFIKSILNK